LQTALIASINSAIGTVGNVSAAADTNPADPPFSIVLTTLATGLGANSTPLNTSIAHYGAGNPNINGVTVTRGFSGGAPPVSGTAVLPACEPLQWTAIGENLYFSGPGPCILQFSYPNEVPTLVLLTQKLGAVTLGKYNNQLIAGGVFNGTTSTPYQFPEMVVAWSAPNNYGQWDAIDGNGFVTGAGFNEISDISDYISGLFISNNVLVVLRSFGVDYMNALQNGVIPFDFNHISNALVGEGCQDSRLATQYDQIGCFVGYSDVYEWAGQLTPIGTKIKTQIINAAVAPPVHRDSIACTALLHFTLNTYAFFLIDRTLFVYCFNNKTWTHFPWQHIAGAADVTHIDHVAQYNTAPEYYEFNNVMIPFMYTNANKFYTIYDNIQTTELPNANPTSLYFRTEEIMFGRDITVDSVYVNMAGSPGQVVNFNVWSESTLVLSGSVTIPAGVSPYQFNNYQVFFTEQVNTLKNPMLQILVPLGTPGVYNKLHFAKIAMFGSFDPAQRPT
jgi:hypothetical protein